MWVSGQSYAVGEQAISPTDFGVYIRKVAGAGTTNPASDATNWQPFGGRAIKTIQRGTVALNDSTQTINITAVNMAKTELRLLSSDQVTPYVSAQTYYRASKNRISLTSATQITASGGIGNANGYSAEAVTVSWELTEYY